MKTVAHIGRINEQVSAKAESKGFALDTTFVLFFLAMEFGRIMTTMSFDLVLMGVTLAGVIALPYFIQGEEKFDVGVWLAGRVWIALFGALIGVLFNQAVGTVFPEMLRFAPMSLLIISAMLSCQIQFYRFLKFKPARQ